MKTIGLVGGVASGKSLVAKFLADLGAGVLDADRAGHEVLAHDADVKQALVDHWGASILATDGTPDRAAIAARVFANDREREFLESILHPRIRTRIEAECRQFAAAGRLAVVLDAPLLLEAGWEKMCDFILFVDVPRDVRLARARTRGWSDDEFARREAAQWPVERKRTHANFVLSNSGNEAELRTAVQHIWQQEIAAPPAAPAQD